MHANDWNTPCRLMLALFGLWAVGLTNECLADDFDDVIKPLLAQRCAKCHSGTKAKGDINFQKLTAAKQLLAKPELLKEMIQAIDANDMPPEGQPALPPKTRTRFLASLKAMLRLATAHATNNRLPIRRLNRFQYNNTVKDLFQLKGDVFRLPEKLMTRKDSYLHPNSGIMPNKVRVACESLMTIGGFRNVQAFPKDLRASHGFDNQANQLTLSPLLLDAFLRLSVSILDSPDFHERNVGIWKEFFAEPTGVEDKQAEVKRRLKPFLKRAFRGPVDDETLKRYSAFTMSHMRKGLPFTGSMKKVASAVLCSPMFLFRSRSAVANRDQFELASNLSYFLWASCPDEELLRLAERGELSKPDTLKKTIDRMLADPKIERFLDSFPAQWMQLENVLAVTPDPGKNRYFRLDKTHPASLQMVLEPLLLFDAVFIENRPIAELIAPKFGYQSEFLKTWYTTDLKPPTVNTARILAENRTNDERRKRLQATISATQIELDTLIKTAVTKILAARKKKGDNRKLVNLKPYAAWEFNGDLKDSVNSLDLKAHGKIRYEQGMAVLDKAYLLSRRLPIDLKAKTLEVWCEVPDLDQRGGGVMGIQGPGDFFDTIVLGERKPRHWISGSNGFSRTEDFPGSKPETKTGRRLHLVMVYRPDGTTALFRDGMPYGRSYRKGSATFPKGRSSVIFGLRHLPPGGNKFLRVRLDKARLYNRALTAAEIAESYRNDGLGISSEELQQALLPKQRTKFKELKTNLAQTQAALKSVPKRQDPTKLQQIAQRRFDDSLRRKLRMTTFERTPVKDQRYGGIITNAAMLSMTSGPKRTHPIARGAWLIEVIFNDPPPPPPNDIPPLKDDGSVKNLTIREQFAIHRKNPNCAGCHSRIDPLGFALENFDITGRWRDKYETGRTVDASGTLIRKYSFDNVVQFKTSLVKEKQRFAKAFAGHLLRFATSRELTAADTLILEEIVNKTKKQDFRLKSIIREIIVQAYSQKHVTRRTSSGSP